MIRELEGTLVRKGVGDVVIRCGGVGYGVAMSVPGLGALGQPGSAVHVFVHTHLTQDALRLFGFACERERHCFEVLLSTPGVGPRLALAILSTLGPDELLGAVEMGDKSMLVRIPGVGAKKAERLLVELKGRLSTSELSEGLSQRSEGRTTLWQDLHSALSNLGFAQTQADQMVQSMRKQQPDAHELAPLVRAALQASYSRTAS